MSGLWRRFVADVGGDPLRLLALLACFALTGYAASKAFEAPLAGRMAIWFVGAAIAHDLVLFPLYAIADRSWNRLLHRAPRPPRGVPVVNYLRIPLGFSLLLLLVFWGLVHADAALPYTTGHPYADYLRRWAVVTGVLFAVSAVTYAVQLARGPRSA